MSAMRLIPKDEFYRKLQEHGFAKQDDATGHHARWLHVKTGTHFYIVDQQEAFPGYFLDRILIAVDALYDKSVIGESLPTRLFEVTERTDSKVVRLPPH